MELRMVRSYHACAVGDFILNYFLQSNRTSKLEVYPPADLIILSWSFRSDMSNTLFTSSLVNLSFAFFLKFIVLLNQSLSKPSFFQMILAAASLSVCYLEGTAVPGTVPSSCWGILTFCGKELPLPNTRIPKLSLLSLRYFFSLCLISPLPDLPFCFLVLPAQISHYQKNIAAH